MVFSHFFIHVFCRCAFIYIYLLFTDISSNHLVHIPKINLSAHIYFGTHHTDLVRAVITDVEGTLALYHLFHFVTNIHSKPRFRC